MFLITKQRFSDNVYIGILLACCGISFLLVCTVYLLLTEKEKKEPKTTANAKMILARAYKKEMQFMFNEFLLYISDPVFGPNLLCA